MPIIGQVGDDPQIGLNVSGLHDAIGLGVC